MYQQSREILVLNYEKFILYDIPKNGKYLHILENKETGKIEWIRQLEPKIKRDSIDASLPNMWRR